MRISFFSPVFVGSNSHPAEKWKILRGATQFFNFGQKTYTILHFTDRNKVEVDESSFSKPSWFGVTMRVMALFTLVIPFVMLLGTLVYRLRNRFEISSRSQNDLITIPEILKEILGFAHEGALNFGATSKAYYQLIKNTPSLKANRVIPLLEKSYNLANNFNPLEKAEVLVSVAKGFSLFDPDRALLVVQEAITDFNTRSQYDYNNENRRDILLKEIYALFDVLWSEERREEILNLIKNVPDGYESLAFIVKKLGITDPQKVADEIDEAILKLNGLQDIPKSENITKLAKVLELLEPSQALERAEELLIIAKTLNAGKYNALTSIVMAIAVSHPERALELSEELTAEANNIPDVTQKSIALSLVVKVFALLDLERAENLANTITDRTQKASAIANIVGPLAKKNPQKAHVLARGISNEDRLFKSEAFAEYAKVLSLTNPKKALDVVLSWSYWSGYQEETLNEIVKNALLLSDMPTALSVLKSSQSEKVIDLVATAYPEKICELNNSTLLNRSRLAIAKGFCTTNRKKAKELVDEYLEKNRSDSVSLKVIDILIKLDDPTKAVDLIKKRTSYYYRNMNAILLAQFSYLYMKNN